MNNYNAFQPNVVENNIRLEEERKREKDVQEKMHEHQFMAMQLENCSKTIDQAEKLLLLGFLLTTLAVGFVYSFGVAFTCSAAFITTFGLYQMVSSHRRAKKIVEKLKKEAEEENALFSLHVIGEK